MLKKNEKKNIQTSVSILREGGVIAFPTETSYGLGCDPRNTKAVLRIFKIKNRDSKKPLLLVAGSWAQIRRVAMVSATTKRFVKQYWPGALTLILPLQSDAGLVAGVTINGEVAIRYSSSLIVRRLTRCFGFPLVATSANISGQPECRSAEDIRSAGLDVDDIIDGGILPVGRPSTIVRMQKGKKIEIIRQGRIHLPGCAV